MLTIHPEVAVLESAHNIVMGICRSRLAANKRLGNLPHNKETSTEFWRNDAIIAEYLAKAKDIHKQISEANEKHKFGPAKSIAKAIVKSIAEQDDFFGVKWPADAEFGITVRYKTWPMGWDKEVNKSFFSTKEELDIRIKELSDWALCEDNECEVEIYKWDLGYDLIGQYYFY